MEAITEIEIPAQTFRAKIADYVQLIKLRLSLLVVFSAAMAYLWASNRHVDALTIWLLSIGGFFITASSNIFNQVMEKKSDKLMKRTALRPLPDSRMKTGEAVSLAILLGITGLFLLLKINFLSFVLGFTAMLIYIAVYTPMKKLSSLTVIPGAVAGSLPVVIGWVAAKGEITHEALILFLIQFIWQFPHTWSIAWLLNDEYKKASIKMLPTRDKGNTSAMLILLSTFLIIPSGFLLYTYESAGIHVMWMLALAGIITFFFALRFYKLRTDKSAVGLMLSCFAYLPIVLIILVTEKFL
jgi:protoheme IX farnesyltransferase